jgi:hypothetical protein
MPNEESTSPIVRGARAAGNLVHILSPSQPVRYVMDELDKPLPSADPNGVEGEDISRSNAEIYMDNFFQSAEDFGWSQEEIDKEIQKRLGNGPEGEREMNTEFVEQYNKYMSDAEATTLQGRTFEEDF